MLSSDYSIDLLESADCVVVITDHRIFNWQEVGDHASLIVDTRHVFANGVTTKARIVTLQIVLAGRYIIKYWLSPCFFNIVQCVFRQQELENLNDFLVVRVDKPSVDCKNMKDYKHN